MQFDEERTNEIELKLNSGIPRYGPEAATLREELEAIKARLEKRKTAAEEEAKKKTDQPKTNKARDQTKSPGKTKTKNKSTENLAPKSETQKKLDKIKERKRMIEESDKEKQKGHGHHHGCVEASLKVVHGKPSMGVPGEKSKKSSMRGKKQAKDEFDGLGATGKRDNWRPPKNVKKHRCEKEVRQG